jgi:hypothetical protein
MPQPTYTYYNTGVVVVNSKVVVSAPGVLSSMYILHDYLKFAQKLSGQTRVS